MHAKSFIIAGALMVTLSGCDGFNAVGDGVKDEMAKQDSPIDQTPAQQAYSVAMEKMHKDMGAIPADPDVAFMAGMIPHHQGAIDMAKIALEHGKDPAVRALAQKVIAAQEAEIAEMKAWLAKRGAAPAPAGATADDHAAMGH